MGVFRFKKFEVINERSAMKVNTDGVLLGAAMTLTPSYRRLLDIGTGTGTIALMAAQRLAGAVWIDAIDIDEPSASEAAANFEHSPWADSLHAYNLSLDEFEIALNTSASSLTSTEASTQHSHEAELTPSALSQTECKFDLIFSNPPYFDDALQAPEERRNAARHTSTGLSYREILDFAARHLSQRGRVALVLPADTERDLTRHARMCGLHLFKITRVRTVPRKAPTRIVAEFSRHRTDTPEETGLTIQNEGQYTQEYLSLTKDFYLFA